MCLLCPHSDKGREPYGAQGWVPAKGEIPVTRTLVVRAASRKDRVGVGASLRTEIVITISQRYNSQVPKPIIQTRKF